MIERAVIYLITAVVLMSLLASVLPRITPSLVALGLLILVGRLVWWYTR
jgi:hypothetical protein